MTSSSASSPPSKTAPKDYLVFTVAGVRLAMDLPSAQQIIITPPLTRLPGVSSAIRGVINVRGKIIPTLNLSPLLGNPPHLIAETAYTIIVEAPGPSPQTPLGILVDTLPEVVPFPVSCLEPLDETHLALKQLFKGQLRAPTDKICLLNLDEVLRPERFTAPPA